MNNNDLQEKIQNALIVLIVITTVAYVAGLFVSALFNVQVDVGQLKELIFYFGFGLGITGLAKQKTI